MPVDFSASGEFSPSTITVNVAAAVCFLLSGIIFLRYFNLTNDVLFHTFSLSAFLFFESEVEEPAKEIVGELIARGIAQDERPSGPVIIKIDEKLGLKKEKIPERPSSCGAQPATPGARVRAGPRSQP
jgi:hypothetical protein